jgi:hypothetical protein
MQKAQPLIWDARVLTNSISEDSSPLFLTLPSSSSMA